MSLFGGVINITGITFFVMSIFAIIVGGYLIGKRFRLRVSRWGRQVSSLLQLYMESCIRSSWLTQ